ncbi:4-methyl-5(B-hydroxyethyl)-thiazole monophosphate biosynthesis enzyme [Sulfurimonas gotlandica GD1]|uniref:4-methyl-5(B-hydroxyethyl)-thiazole monophosphate biosynthesis enzyme n=1 Tax=Sulfurimonas gotlandica (strain DSM 19862 / JCM 16533 / GD1) TaxID=929558 RepID=B6BNG8_SULGG|nr:DJ-1 family glyoxalase III [Sulfurimonas gotlandica]EDZ61424.1 DJ-1 [Sulfurimonas gotlandica GD1]EHP31038.1 4-methyl-5(B-hydroxyethyl)-thiazole monophosphate biosynthesis enzyme [Sulfurimonas gotlandica GD1]
MSRVLVPIAGGFEEIEAVSIIDVLRRADVEVLVASLDDKSAVKGANGITIVCDMDIKDVDAETLDMIILPGGWDGTYALADDENVQRILKDMDAKGKNIAAICAAPFALHKAGVLKQNYTCYPSVEEQIRLDGYQGDKAMVVEDSNVMTSRGPGTAICFALAIVKKLKGEETYKMIRAGVLANFCEEVV